MDKAMCSAFYKTAPNFIKTVIMRDLKMINKDSKALHIGVVRSSAFSDMHPLCKGDGIDHCDYYTTIDCDECKYGGGNKNPEAKCNRME